MNAKAGGVTDALHRDSAWTRQFTAELGSILLGTLGLAATIEWPEDYASTIFDVYSEALSNVARHAGASRVAIALTITPHEVTMAVHDDGIGLVADAAAASLGGIAGIRAHAQTHNGSCKVAGTHNLGTTVTVSLPIP